MSENQGYKCVTCGNIYKLEEDLLAHMKSKHFNKPDGLYETKEESEKKDEQKAILKLGPSEAHLQNVVKERKCYICGKEVTKDTGDIVLLRKDMGKKKMVFACTNHAGITIEFIKQYGRPPLGWKKTQIGEAHAGSRNA